MRKILFILILLSYSYCIYSADFENNFLSGYLDFEEFFLNLKGDYGTDFFPILNRSLGGRELGLSGAFAGAADDISTIESNPAGTASLENTEFMFSHSKMFGDVNYSTLGYTMRFNELGFGLSARMAYLPFTHYDMIGDEQGSSIISYTVVTFNGAYNLFRSYEQYGFSLGGNVKLYIYSVPEEIVAGQSRVNVAFDAGILTRQNFLKFYKSMDKNFSIGFVVKNVGPFTDDDPPPTSVNLGLSYKPVKNFMATVDLNYLINYSALTYYNWNLKTGLEYKITDYLSILGGVNIKSSPSASIGVNIEFETFKITAIYNPDMVDVSQFAISASIKFGDMGRKKKDENVNALYSNVLGHLAVSEYDAAKAGLDEILVISPNYTPAKRTLKVVTEHNELYSKVEKAIEESEKIFD